MTSKAVRTTVFFLVLFLTQPACAQTDADGDAAVESRLEMPNAFSPDGDGVNDIYRAKSGYQNITSFRATVFNRWGQKLYAWEGVDGGWDGTSDGQPVKNGVYFVRVTATGGDGRRHNFRKAVTLLRGSGSNEETR